MFQKKTLLLITVLVCNLVFAQSSLSEKQNFLIYSKHIGEDLLLFVPDTTAQIFFNPVRANNYSKSFIYTSYNSTYSGGYYSTNDIIMRTNDITIYESGNYNSRYNLDYYSPKLPTLSLAALFNKADSKWLLTFSNGIRYSDNESNDEDVDLRTINDPYTNRIRNTIFDNHSKISTTSFLITKIFNAFSFGVFGNFNQLDAKIDEDRLYQYDYSYSDYRSHDYNEESNNSQFKQNQYQAGLTLSLIGENWDFTGEIAYQKSDLLNEIEYFNLRNNFDSTFYDSSIGWRIRQNHNEYVKVSSIKSKPDNFQFKAYFQKQLSWLSADDHVFVKTKVAMSSGKIEYAQNQSYHRIYSYYDTTTTYNTTDVIGVGKIDSDDKWLAFSLGYAVKFNLDDIFFLLAINPDYQHYSASNMSFESSSYYIYRYPEAFEKRKIDYNRVDLKLPLFINYSPTKWISLFGGLTYNYGYISSKIKYTSLSGYNSNSLSYVNNKSEDNYSIINSFRSKYIGIKLKHKSGLKLLVSFNNDISNFSYWDFSLGYHF